MESGHPGHRNRSARAEQRHSQTFAGVSRMGLCDARRFSAEAAIANPRPVQPVQKSSKNTVEIPGKW